MQIKYSPEDDILYTRFRKAREVACVGVTETIHVDLDAHNRLAGIEILNVSQQIGQDNWTDIDIAGLTSNSQSSPATIKKPAARPKAEAAA